MGGLVAAHVCEFDPATQPRRHAARARGSRAGRGWCGSHTGAAHSVSAGYAPPLASNVGSASTGPLAL
jgi:hypothetical protein